MSKTVNRVATRDDVARIVAKMHGVTPQYVRMVRNGERNNEEILATLIDFKVAKSQLIKHLEKLVPVKPNPKKYAR